LQQVYEFSTHKVDFSPSARLQHCRNLKKFPEILGAMENIEAIVLEGTSVEKLSFSFQNLTRLRTLRLWGNGILMLPSSILLLPNLSWMLVEDCILLPILNDKPSSKVSSNLQNLILQNCNISDAFFSIIITWFANMEYLEQSRNNFTILPKCIEECHLLSSLVLDGCPSLFINGSCATQLMIHCTHVFHLHKDHASYIQSNDQWIHVELKVESRFPWRHRTDEVMESISAEMGVHVMREKKHTQ